MEIRLIIFEKLNLRDLLVISKTNSENRAIVDYIFRNSPTFRLSTWIFEITHNSFDIAPAYHYRLGYSTEFGLTLYFIRTFGHLMTKWKIFYSSYYARVTPKQCKFFNRYISEYAANFVEEIKLSLEYESMSCSVNDLAGPFRNVKKVTFAPVIHRYTEIIDYSNNSIYNRISTLFPAMMSLEFNNFDFHQSLNHFPNLIRFTVNDDKRLLDPEIIKPAMELLKRMFQLNPQLQHVSISRYCTWDGMVMLANNLPNLKSLEVFDIDSYSFALRENDPANYSGYNGEIIRFENLTKFEFRQFRSTHNFLQRIPLKFGKLEHFLFSSKFAFNGPESIENWIQILLDNRNLKTIVVGNELNYQQLERIADGLPNLKEFTQLYMKYSTSGDLPIDNVVRFMERALQLKRVTLSGLNYIEQERCEAVVNRLRNQWTIESYDSSMCIFVRQCFFV